MHIKQAAFTILVSILVLLVGVPTVQAQYRGLKDPNTVQDEWILAVGAPGDDGEDESDDETDDEGTDCSTVPSSVPRTGQTITYAPGDDGAWQAGDSVAPRFTDNLDGTVTDELTGLIWMQTADCFGSQAWSDALSSANGLAVGFCGLMDASILGEWRLPNLRELQSVLDYGRRTPALPLDHPFSDVQDAVYWSSTTVAGDAGLAWFIDLTIGRADTGHKSDSAGVWAVRGGELPSDGGPALQIVALDTPPVTGNIQGSGTCSEDPTIPCTSDFVCQFAMPPAGFCENIPCVRVIQDWTAALANVPRNSLTINSPLDDILLDQLNITYTPALSGVSGVVVGLGNVLVPANGTATVTFEPTIQQALADIPDDEAVTTRVELVFVGHTPFNSEVRAVGTVNLSIEQCFGGN